MDYFLITIIVVILLFEGIPLIKKVKLKEFIVLTFLLLTSLTFIILHLAGSPSPFMIADKLVYNLVSTILGTH